MMYSDKPARADWTVLNVGENRGLHWKPRVSSIVGTLKENVEQEGLAR